MIEPFAGSSPHIVVARKPGWADRQCLGFPSPSAPLPEPGASPVGCHICESRWDYSGPVPGKPEVAPSQKTLGRASHRDMPSAGWVVHCDVDCPGSLFFDLASCGLAAAGGLPSLLRCRWLTFGSLLGLSSVGQAGAHSLSIGIIFFQV